MSWPFASSPKRPRIAIGRWASFTSISKWCPASSRTISPRPSAMDIGRSTPPSSTARMRASRCRSAVRTCTATANSGWRRTGHTSNRAAVRPPGRTGRRGGCAIWSKFSNRARMRTSFSNIPAWRCIRIASSPSRPRVNCTSCPRDRRPSISLMPSTPGSATRQWVRRSMAASCRCARPSKMAIRSKS